MSMESKQRLSAGSAATKVGLARRYSAIKAVSQTTFTIKKSAQADVFHSTIQIILGWLASRAGKSLPPEAWEKKSFEVSGIGAQPISVVALTEPLYWAARLVDADKTVPLRTWTTEIGIGLDDSGDVLFGTRVISAARGDDPPYFRSIPGFVKRLLNTAEVELDGIRIENSPRFLQTEADVRALVTLLEQPDRQADVLVISTGETSSDFNDTLVSAEVVHRELSAVAHIFVLSGPASFHLTKLLGKELSVFSKAIRTYKPGFRTDTSDPPQHPIAFAAKIQSFPSTSEGGFERWLIEQTLASTNYSPTKEDRLPSFEFIRQLQSHAMLAHLKSSGASDADMLSLYAEEVAILEKRLQLQLEEFDGLLDSAEKDRKDALQLAETAKAQSIERLHRIKVLEKKLADNAQQATPIPDSLVEFEQWCKDHLQGKVEVAKKAYSAVRKSTFHEPSLIYRALVLLRDEYHRMRTEASAERKQAYLEALNALQLEDEPTGEAVKTNPDTYSAVHNGRRYLLENHLKGSSSRRREFGFRVYFCWDEEEELVVVGWLPEHLPNRAS